MNLRDLRYLVAVADHGHFGRAAKACHISQPTLSGQIRRLEGYLGVCILERRTHGVIPTDIGRRILDRARQALAHADAIEAEARAARDPFADPLRLGVIPTLGPYLMPAIFERNGADRRKLAIELWEDVTKRLIDHLRAGRLDAVIMATDVNNAEISEMPLFEEPFVAAVPVGHSLAVADQIEEHDLASDILVLDDPHCLRDQALAACGRRDQATNGLRASSLETLVNLVAAGYGTTLVPALACDAMAGRAVLLRPLAGGAYRTVRLVSRAKFARRPALEALGDIIRGAVEAIAAQSGVALNLHPPRS